MALITMGKWSKKYERCLNCCTDRHPHKFRGYCNRCYYLMNRIEQVKKWDRYNPSTLKGFPSGIPWDDDRTFEKVKEGHLRQIKGRLNKLKTIETKLNRKIDGLDLEYQFRRIARLARCRNKNLFFGLAGYIEDNFPPETRKVLFRLLNKIEEDIPWKGINYGEILLGKDNK